MKKLILAAAVTSTFALVACNAVVDELLAEKSVSTQALAPVVSDCKDGGSLVKVDLTLNNLSPCDIDDFVSCPDQEPLYPFKIVINLVKPSDHAPYSVHTPHKLKTVESILEYLYSKTEKYLDELSDGSMGAIRQSGFNMVLRIRDKKACITITNIPGAEKEVIAKGKEAIETLIQKLKLNIVSIRKADSCNKVMLPIANLDTKCAVLNAFLQCSQKASMNLIPQEWANGGISCDDK